MIKQQFYKDLTRKKKICEGRTWFKFNNLGLEPGMSLKFYTSVTKEIKLNVKKFWGRQSSYVYRSYRDEIGRGEGCGVGAALFTPHPE